MEPWYKYPILINLILQFLHKRQWACLQGNYVKLMTRSCKCLHSFIKLFTCHRYCFFFRTFVSLVEYSVVSIANLINYSNFWKMFSNLDVTFSDNCSCLKIQLGLFRLLCFSWDQFFYFDVFCQSQITGDNSDT